VSSMSAPYRQSPASSRKRSLAPRPHGSIPSGLPASSSCLHTVSARVGFDKGESQTKISNPSSPVYPVLEISDFMPATLFHLQPNRGIDLTSWLLILSRTFADSGP